MSNITVSPSSLCGNITVPPSKSDVHRAIICAALSKGVTAISPVAFSQDILATLDCIAALGANYSISGNTVTVNSEKIFSNPTAHLDCRESGSTVRFFIPIAAAGGVSAVFTGKGRLPERPLGVYSDLLPRHGVECKTPGGLPFEISGKLTSGQFNVPGDISSQFITGLLFSLPLLHGDSLIHLTSPLQSKGYIDMTISVMSHFGVEVTENNGDYYVKGNQKYTPCTYTTEGDWSQAAFFLAAGALGGSVTVNGVRSNSLQGDKEIAELLCQFGAKITIADNYTKCEYDTLCGIEIDASQIPDIVPILAVCGAFAQGTTRIYNAKRVRLKESDRLDAMYKALSACGADIEQTEDELIIHGGVLHTGTVDGCNDHRIVMSMAIAGLCANGNITISDKESISKSYNNFFDDYISLGGIAK
ncbi:MAG: 3-phosphoshikimate 1-carboxyvinyltransferase [Clostridia bacterium]|nr:3-phosphoshikimate 1-carboxyvinyltransferase [Clostridia bacterium]